MTDFNWKFYCHYYPDLVQSGVNTEDKAIKHFREFGQPEGRIPNASKLKTPSFHKVELMKSLCPKISPSDTILELDIKHSKPIQMNPPKLPYPNATFTHIIAPTWMLNHSASDWLLEFRRVLKPNGLAFLGYLIWTPDLSPLIKSKGTSLTLPSSHRGDQSNLWVVQNRRKERVIATAEISLWDWHHKAKLPITSITYGVWSEPPSTSVSSDNQPYIDFIVATAV
jgi:hypothetical protein